MRSSKTHPPLQPGGLPVCLLVLVLVAVGCGGGRPVRPGTAPRHALLVTIEGLRADHCSATLYARDTTGLAIDELAHAGVLFPQAMAPAGDAGISLAALHSGGLSLGPTQGEPRTLAQRFASAGFETAAFVAWSGEFPRPLGRGFEFRGSFSGHAASADANVVSNALQWLAGRADPARPFFLWLHLRQPAFPFEPGYGPAPAGEQLDFASLFTDPLYSGPTDGSAAYRQSVRDGVQPDPAQADLRHIVALYDGELAATDARLHGFFEALRARGSWDETACVLVGANGVRLGASGARWGETDSLRDDSLRVPLILRHPQSLTGRRILGDVVELGDIAVTLADWFALDWEAEDLAGSDPTRSLLALTDSYVERTYADRPALAHSSDGRRSLRTQEWRLLSHPPQTAGAEPTLALHPVALTVESERDLAAHRPAVVQQLAARLRAGAGGGKK